MGIFMIHFISISKKLGVMASLQPPTRCWRGGFFAARRGLASAPFCHHPSSRHHIYGGCRNARLVRVFSAFLEATWTPVTAWIPVQVWVAIGDAKTAKNPPTTLASGSAGRICHRDSDSQGRVVPNEPTSQELDATRAAEG